LSISENKMDLELDRLQQNVPLCLYEGEDLDTSHITEDGTLIPQEKDSGKDLMALNGENLSAKENQCQNKDHPQS